MTYTTKAGHSLAVGALLSGALGAGCQGATYELEQLPPARFESEEQVRALALGSAGSAGALVYGLLTVTRASPASSAEAGCPRVTVSGDTVTLEGGCTDASGARQEGRVTLTAPAPVNGRPGGGAAAVRSEELTTTRDIACGGRVFRIVTAGELRLTATTTGARTEYDFVYVTHGSSLERSNCEVREVRGGWSLRGTIDYGETNDPVASALVQTHNGEGRFGVAPYGIVSVRTRDEVIDRRACSTEPLSGSTSLTAGEHTVVLTYDGASACDVASAVRWSLDGQPRGALQGVACSAGRTLGANPAGRTVASVGLALCAMLALQRTIRRPPRR